VPMEYPVPDPLEVGELSTEEKPVFDVTQYGAKGDGSTIDRSAIQDAIDVAEAAGGGVVFFPEGTYLVDRTVSEGVNLLINSDNVDLLGVGRSSVIKKNDEPGADEGSYIIRITGSDCSVRNLTVDGNKANQGDITGPTDGSSIQPRGDRNTVMNVHSINAGGDGIEARGDTRTIVAYNYFLDSFEHNIHFNDSSYSMAIGNLCDGEENQGQITTFSGDGVTDHVVIANNMVINGSKQGIRVEGGGSTGEARKILVANNIVYNQDLEGMWIRTRAYDSIITGNIIANTGWEGINPDAQDGAVENITIKDNQIYGCGSGKDRQIHVYGCENLLIEGNRIQKPPSGCAGILADGESGCVPSKIWVKDNHVNQGGVDAPGIRIDLRGLNFDRILVKDNEVIAPDGAAHHGILFHDSVGGGSFSNTDCVRNYIYGFSWQPVNTAANVMLRHNIGHPTENQGTATITSGSTSVTVSHGLNETPDASDIQVTPIEPLGAASYFYVDRASIDADSFDIVVDADPTQDVDFAWEAKINA